MKTILSLAFLFMFSSALLAQNSIQKGTFNLAGSISFSTTSTEHQSDNQNTFTFSPQVGYFFLDNISLSLQLQYANSSLGDLNNTQWGLGPGFRYYFPLDKVIPFLGLSYLYNKSTNNSDATWTNNMFIIWGGLDYFLNESVAIETSLSYSFENTKLPDSYGTFLSDLDYNSNTFRVGVGINVFIK